MAKPTQEEIRASLLQTVDWAPADIATLRGLQTTRDLAFAAGSRFPPGAFRALAALPRLQFLSFTGSDLAAGDLADIARLPLLRHLFLNDCPRIGDTEIEAFAHQKPARLVHFWLANTGITNRALIAIGEDLPGVFWLDLRGTAITDAGMPHLQRVQSLATLYLDQTAVTNEGLLALSALPRLKIVTCRETAITPEGIEALFKAQIVRRRNAVSPAPSVTDAVAVAQATETLLGFMAAMRAWEQNAYRDLNADEGFSATYLERHLPPLQAIFARFCTNRPRADGPPNLHSVGDPPTYDPAETGIRETEQPKANTVILYTRERFGTAYQYVLKRTKNEWRLDHRKSRGDTGWRQAPL